MGLLARLAKIQIIYGSVLLLLVDWIASLEFISPAYGIFLRAASLVSFLLYLAVTGINHGKYRFGFGVVLASFNILNIIYSLISDDILGNLYYSVRILFWTSLTVVFYRLYIFNIILDADIRRFAIATIAVGSLFTILYMLSPATEAGQNASAYLLVWTLPLFFLVSKESFFRLVVVFVVCCAVFMTVKRGAIIALTLSMIAYYFSATLSGSGLKNFLRNVSAVGAIALVMGLILLVNLEAFSSRFSDSSGSGRDWMYSVLFVHYFTADFASQLFGFGVNSVQEYTGRLLYGEFSNKTGPYAHSDWIQLAHDFGLVGISLLTAIHLRLIWLLRYAKRYSLGFLGPLSMAYIIFFLVNIYSGHIFAPGAFVFGMIVALCEARRLRHELHYNSI